MSETLGLKLLPCNTSTCTSSFPFHLLQIISFRLGSLLPTGKPIEVPRFILPPLRRSE